MNVANFLVGKVSDGSIEKVVKGRWPLTLRRRRRVRDPPPGLGFVRVKKKEKKVPKMGNLLGQHGACATRA